MIRYMFLRVATIYILYKPLFYCFYWIPVKHPFLYNINEVRLNEDEKNLNAKNIEKIQRQASVDTMKFILIGDSQRFYEEVDDFVAKINGVEGISFIILAGDISPDIFLKGGVF